MADAPGEDVAVLLLRLMPPDVGEAILDRIGPAEAARLRARLAAAAPTETAPTDELDSALAHFFDLQRIAERRPAAPPPTPPEPEAPRTPVEEIRALPPASLAKALDGEQPGTMAVVLSCLQPAAAGQVLQYLPLDLRADVALRMTRGGARNPMLVERLVKAVAEKGRRLRELPREPSQEDLIGNLADMLRAMPRAERLPVLKKIEDASPELAAKVAEKLYRMEDLLRIRDRQIQTLLGKLDLKTLALALAGSPPEVAEKVRANMSSRSRDALNSEIELLGDPPQARVREAQAKVLGAVRKGEEDGEITPED
jgi:flagellar motor switch protein FliG